MITFELDDIRDLNSRLSSFINYLTGYGVDDDGVFYSRLVACELLTNALRHCGGTARFSGLFSEGDIVISVRSENIAGELKIPTLPDALQESGRGLYIINAVSDGNVVFDGGNVTVTLKKEFKF